MYSQLHDLDCIRILELTQNHQGTPFCGRLMTTRLDEGSDYVALSYVWGKESSDDPILHLDGCPLQIRASLWQALQELTTHGYTVRLRVDQICINQKNDAEKEQQVQLMSKTYAQAQRVVGWLGCHEEDSHLAFDLLLVLGASDIAHEVQPDLNWRRAANALIKDGHLYRLENLFDPTRKSVQAVARLVLRPWFYRL